MPSQFGGIAIAKQSRFGGVPIGEDDVDANTVTRTLSDEQVQDSADPAGLNADSDSRAVGQNVLGGLGDAALEIMAGVNRGAISMADLPAGFVNAIMQLSGSDARVPTIGGTEIGQAATAGGFIENPAARQALGTLGEFLTPAPPIAALSKTDDAIRLADDLLGTADDIAAKIPQSATKKAIAQKIKDNPSSIEVGKFLVTGTGRVKKDALFAASVKQGFNKGVLAAVKGSNPKDRRQMAEMVKILKKGRDDALFAAKTRPSDIAGKTLLDRINYIKSVNVSSGKSLNKIANGLRGKKVDLSKPITSFAKRMDGFGVKLADDGAGGFKPDFTDSVLSPGDRGPIKEVFRQMSRIGRQGEPDALSAHQLKRIIDNNVIYGKTKTGLGGDASRALKEFRAGLDEVLDSNFPAYNKVNTDFSKTIHALDSFQSSSGTKLDLFGPNADKSIGTSLRRLLSNTQSRVKMIDAIDELETVAKGTGKVFDDNVLTQVLFADELDSMFGAAGRTSFKGQIQQAVETGAQAARRGLTDTAIDAGSSLAKRVSGINEENAIKSIELFLRQ